MKDTKNFAAMSDPALNPGFQRSWTEPSRCKTPSLVGSAVAEIVSDLRYRRQIEQVHALGSRVLSELLAEIAVKHSIVSTLHKTLERYASIDPQALRALGGDTFPRPPLYEVVP